MEKWQFKSNRQRYFEQVRKWITLSCISLAASIFWAAIIAGAVRYIFQITEENAFFFVLIPASGLMIIYFYCSQNKLAHVMGFD